MRWLSEKRRWLWVYLALAFGWVGTYLLTSMVLAEPGFPLDDAWIHQTYARNLALTGRWEYVSGMPSSGSTAPLWTLLLALGYWLHIPYRLWAWGLGVASLGWLGWLSHRLSERLFPEARRLAPAIGVLCVSEWHLVWAAASGMETILFVALLLALMERFAHALRPVGQGFGRRWLVVGILSGLLVLTRPEGVVLVGLLALWAGCLVLRKRLGWGKALRAAVLVAGPFATLVIPYLLVNMNLSGWLWPNTFYAKQTEYAFELAAPLLERLARVSLPPLTGYQVMVLPGLFLAAWILVRDPRSLGWGAPASVSDSSSDSTRKSLFLPRLLPLLFLLAHLILYAFRLPVTYQHGRYAIPVIPFVIMYGVLGTARWLRPRHPNLWPRVIGRSWLLATLVLVLVFLGIGAEQYARDVGFIQGEMVAVARWLADNTGPDEWVAAHDIGAIGYFADRPILDLAGLISPEVVPLMNNEAAMADYLLSSKARYLATAPGWPYDCLTSRPGVELLYNTNFRWTVDQGMNNSLVFWLDAESRP